MNNSIQQSPGFVKSYKMNFNVFSLILNNKQKRKSNRQIIILHKLSNKQLPLKKIVSLK